MENNKVEKKYWLEPNEKPISEGEFLSTPAKTADPATAIASHDGLDSESRRDFLKLMGASFALMGTAACTRSPVEKIIPYVKKPEEVMPGIANWYASTCSECETGCGVLVKTRESRPIKFEGNPKHPTSQGGLCARGQASVLNLYDPDRLQGPLAPMRKGTATSAIGWDELDSKIVEKLRSAHGKVRVLMGENSKPSTRKIIDEFCSTVGAGSPVVWEPQGLDEHLDGQSSAYGSRVAPHYHFDKADYVLSFGADFLGTWGNTVAYAKGFSRRKKLGSMAQAKKAPIRFVAIESSMNVTGANADTRYRVPSGSEVRAALAVAHELLGHSRYAGDSSVRALLDAHSPAMVSKELGVDPSVFKKIAEELWAHRGASIVLGAGHSLKGSLGRALEVTVAFLNSMLENDGATIDGTAAVLPRRSSYAALAKLIGEMKAGAVDVLVIYGVNPAYALPKSADFEAAASKVGTVVYLGSKMDETAHLADYVASTSHALESWGDGQAEAGVYSIQQPTIRPLYNTRPMEETLLVWGKKMGASWASAPTWHEFLKANWKETVYREHGGAAPFVLFWESVLREGLVDARKGGAKARSFNTSSLRSVADAMAKAGVTGSELRLVVHPRVGLYDGRNANNGWLQELPDPVSKTTWDNHASFSVATAKKLSLREGDTVRLKTASGEIDLPAHIQPGLHDNTVMVAPGYGQSGAGRVADGVGVNAYRLASASADGFEASSVKVAVQKTGSKAEIAMTQLHHRMEGRPILKEALYEEYEKSPDAGNEKEGKLTTLWPKYNYPGYRWAMAIDLNSCTGCSACVIGCQAENNIPVVGKKFSGSSRGMHWIRIDRYYSGSDDNPEVSFQPMLCQHCENAPCETVCPVLATMHDDEGINQQVYNRCVGTRYCENNCPYKVRRFNWFTFTEVARPLNLVFNPDVTVRTRGVMEKCTFCIERIREGKDNAKDLGVSVADGEIKTACQQSCPSDAIVFGNINDKNSRVAKIAEDPRGYHVLEDLNTRPSITYLTKIRNKDA